MRAPIWVFPAPGGPWIGSTPSRCGAIRIAAARFVSSARLKRLTARAGCSNQKQIARGLVGPFADQTVIGHVVANAHQCIGYNLRIDNLGGRTRLRDGG